MLFLLSIPVFMYLGVISFSISFQILNINILNYSYILVNTRLLIYLIIN